MKNPYRWNVVGGLVLATVATWSGVRAGEPLVLKVDQDGVQRATITLDSYSYAPDHLVVQAGKPVELTLTSVTFIVPHNFLLKDPEAGLEISQDVKAGQTVTVRFTPAKPGSYPFFCDKKPPIPFAASHREKGMEGRLEVRE